MVQHAETRPSLFERIPGAIEMLEHLQRLPDATVGLATGAILESCRIKLGVAGFACDSVPMASGSDAVTREEIMLLAERQAAELVGITRFRTRTYVGDVPWDMRAANNLGFHFIGIAEGANTEALKTRRARRVIWDYAESTRFLEMLQSIWST